HRTRVPRLGDVSAVENRDLRVPAGAKGPQGATRSGQTKDAGAAMPSAAPSTAADVVDVSGGDDASVSGRRQAVDARAGCGLRLPEQRLDDPSTPERAV